MLSFTKAIISLSLLLLARQANAAYTAKKIFQFPSSPYIALENIVIRPNGQLILSVVTSATVFTLDPSDSQPNATRLHDFNGSTSCLGLTEIASDQYAVVVGNVNTTTYQGTPGSFSLWKLDFRKCPVAITKIAAVPDAHILNGLTHLPGNKSIILAADSAQGIIYKINTITGAVSTASHNTAFAPTSAFPLGVNGIHAAGKFLYYTNSAVGTYGKISLDAQGQSAGAATIISHDGSGSDYDDFALDSAGNAFITNHPYAVTDVNAGGAQNNIVNSTTVNQPTSLRIGLDGQTIFVVTAGKPGVGSGQVYTLTPS